MLLKQKLDEEKRLARIHAGEDPDDHDKHDKDAPKDG